MHIIDYYNSLNREEKIAFAARAGTTIGYLKSHIFTKVGFRKVPGIQLLAGLANATEGNTSVEEIVEYFVTESVRKYANEEQQEAA